MTFYKLRFYFVKPVGLSHSKSARSADNGNRAAPIVVN